MTHYLLLKFEPNYFNDKLFQYIKETYLRIKEAIENIEAVAVYKNCLDRQGNMDVMIKMDLEGEDTLNTYLEHELHKAFVKAVDEHVVLRVSFDVNE